MDPNNTNSTTNTSETPTTPVTPTVPPTTSVTPAAQTPVVTEAQQPTPVSTTPTATTSFPMGSTPGTSTTDSMMSAATTTDPSLQTAEAAMKPPAETPAPVNNPGDAGYTKTKSHNMLFVVVAIVSIVAVSLVVLFFYQQYRALSQPEEVNAKPTRLMPTRKPQVSPTVTPASQEERELQNIQLEDVDKEITDIEKDVKGL